MARPATRVVLISSKRAEATAHVERLRALGHVVDADFPAGPELLRALRATPPAAVVIDLSRAPSQGRDAALAIRAQRATRTVPLVFVGGDVEKVTRVRELLPDAVFTTWEEIGRDLPRAITHRPVDPVAPASALAGYSGTPLPRKLGIKPGTALALVGAPTEFAATLGELPNGVTVSDAMGEAATLAMWFVRSRADLERGIAGAAARLADVPLWIAWPKKTSALASDVGEREVRAAGMAAGLVDYKVCAIDATWSGLLFTRRRKA